MTDKPTKVNKTPYGERIVATAGEPSASPFAGAFAEAQQVVATNEAQIVADNAKAKADALAERQAATLAGKEKAANPAPSVLKNTHVTNAIAQNASIASTSSMAEAFAKAANVTTSEPAAEAQVAEAPSTQKQPIAKPTLAEKVVDVQPSEPVADASVLPVAASEPELGSYTKKPIVQSGLTVVGSADYDAGVESQPKATVKKTTPTPKSREQSPETVAEIEDITEQFAALENVASKVIAIQEINFAPVLGTTKDHAVANVAIGGIMDALSDLQRCIEDQRLPVKLTYDTKYMFAGEEKEDGSRPMTAKDLVEIHAKLGDESFVVSIPAPLLRGTPEYFANATHGRISSGTRAEHDATIQAYLATPDVQSRIAERDTKTADALVVERDGLSKELMASPVLDGATAMLVLNPKKIDYSNTPDDIKNTLKGFAKPVEAIRKSINDIFPAGEPISVVAPEIATASQAVGANSRGV